MEMRDLICKYESKSLTLPTLPVGYIQVKSSVEEWTSDSSQHSQQNVLLPFAAESKCHSVPIKSSRLLTTSSNQNVKPVYELLFDVEQIKEFLFNPGDTIGILPINSDDEVTIVLEAASLSELSQLKIAIELAAGSKKKLPNHLPQETSIRKCLLECLDLHAIPKKLFLRSLIEHLVDDEERRVLAILCSKEGATDYSERILTAGVGFFDILQMFKSWNQIPFQLLLEHLPRLLPRPYSIANSPLQNQNILKIWFSLAEPPGVTTKMLHDMIKRANSGVTTMVPIYLRQSNAFSYTLNEMTDPVIFVAAGVGVSPFLGFLEHREQVQKSDKEVRLANATMFYGCRQESESLCKDIFRHHLQAGSLSDLKEAFSRDVNSQHKYVQDQIQSNANMFAEVLIRGKGRIYVCGSANMVQDVRKSIQNCLAEHLDDSTTSDTIESIQKLIRDKRYVEDTWI
ncbi:methionine synthase reductase [Bradysia coprophila]|uniref:methionine synthase reductase n=1 Tax=Bradysia coprophila TaxID=38358 RepID=UPI00187DC79E|nr:methionine synthase reductase [Bradysia coprophila]